MNKNRIAVLITCHNRKEKTIACISSLFRQHNLGIEYDVTVFLVDDGSTDGTAELVKDRFPSVRIIPGDGNLYWNRGMHLAWEEAAKQDFDFYLWLNDDTTLTSNALTDLVNCAEQTNAKSIICGTTRSAKNGVATYGGRTKEKGLIEPNGQLQLCNFFNGNCILVPRNVYNIVGNLDNGFIHAMGDYDYGLRAGKAGVQSYVCTSYVGLCEKHQSIDKWCSPTVQLKERIKAFKTPLAVNPSQYFRYDYRHNGLLPAITHYITIHIRLLFPSWWSKKNKFLMKD